FLLSILFHCHLHLLDLHSFPTRRSSDLSISSLILLNSPGSKFFGSSNFQSSRCSACTNGHSSPQPIVIAYSYFTFGISSNDLERSEEHTSELQSPYDLVCRLLLEKKKQQ